jgi:hypothetical protein
MREAMTRGRVLGPQLEQLAVAFLRPAKLAASLAFGPAQQQSVDVALNPPRARVALEGPDHVQAVHRAMTGKSSRPVRRTLLKIAPTRPQCSTFGANIR